MPDEYDRLIKGEFQPTETASVKGPDEHDLLMQGHYDQAPPPPPSDEYDKILNATSFTRGEPAAETGPVRSPYTVSWAAKTAAAPVIRKTASIMDSLDFLNYPMRAVASTGQEALQGRGRMSPATAAWQGLIGQRDTDWGDVARLPRTKPGESWGEWASHEVPRFLLNIIGDPWTWGGITAPVAVAGRVAKSAPLLKSAAEALRPALKAVEPIREAVAGTKPAQWFYTQAPGTEAGLKFRGMLEDARTLKRRMDFEKQQLEDASLMALEDARKEPLIAALAAAERTGADYAPLSKLITKGLPEDALRTRVLRNLWETADPALPYWTDKSLMAQHARSAELRDLYNTKYAPEMNVPEIGLRSEETGPWTPRPPTPFGERRLAKYIGAVPDRAALRREDFPSRTLQKALDPVTGKPLLDDQGLPIVRKFTEPMMGDQEIGLGEATLKDIESTIPSLYKAFIADPARAYGESQGKVTRQIAFADFMQKLRDAKMTWEANPAGTLMKPRQPKDYFDWRDMALRDMAGKSQMPENLVGVSRPLKVPGWENYLTPKWMANQLENEAGVGRGVGPVLGTLQDLTTNWKRNQLGVWPAYHIGNFLSNQQLMYAATSPRRDTDLVTQVYDALSYPGQHLRNMGDAYRVQFNPTSSVFSGMKNADLRHEIAMRGGIGTGMYGKEAGLGLGTTDAQGRTRRLVDTLAKFAEGRTAGAGEDVYWALNPLARFAEGWGRLNTGGLRLGANVEDNARISVILDYLKKNAFDPITMDKEDQKKLLDEAVRYGKDALVDYGKATPFEQQYLNKFAEPFYNWNKGITMQMARSIARDPGRMAKLSRFTDAMSEPLTPEEMAVAPPYVARGMATKRIAGFPLGETEGLPNILLQQRLNPFANVTDWLNPRGHTQFANPLIKTALAVALNRDLDTGEPLDPRAQSGIEALTNPFTGDPNYQRSFSNTLFWRLPKGLSYLARTSPLGRGLNMATQQLLNIGAIPDPKMKAMTGFRNFLWTLSGFKTMPFDQTRYMIGKYFKAGQKARGWEDDIKQGAMLGESPEEMARLISGYEQAVKEQNRAMGQLD